MRYLRRFMCRFVVYVVDFVVLAGDFNPAVLGNSSKIFPL